MAENKKYYFLKLKEDFFDQREIVVLEGSKDGILYVNILLKLYLKSLQHNGKLLLNERTPLSAEMIALLTRHEAGTVERAMRAFMQLGLVAVQEDDIYYMPEIEQMTEKGILPCPYGKYGNVILTDRELETLKNDFPADYLSMIEHLSEYMEYSGRTYKNHLATMECWKRADLKKEQETGRGYSYNSSFKEGDSL